jgi:hypothetical protein
MQWVLAVAAAELLQNSNQRRIRRVAKFDSEESRLLETGATLRDSDLKGHGQEPA